MVAACDYLGGRGQQIEAERDRIETVYVKIASLEKALHTVYDRRVDRFRRATE